jgi:DNA-binding beta-propeller fold protein YncE
MRLKGKWIILSGLALALAGWACKLSATAPAATQADVPAKYTSPAVAASTAIALPDATGVPTATPRPTATVEPTPILQPPTFTPVLTQTPTLTPIPSATLPIESTLAAVTPTQQIVSGPMDIYIPPPFPGHVLSVESGLPVCDDHMLQDRLASLGYLEPGGIEWRDGTFGSQTEAAVLAFEKANGLAEDGRVDWQEWGALFNPAAAPAGGNPAPTAQPDPSAEIFQVGENPVALAFDGERIWVAHANDNDRSGNTLLAIDPAAGTISAPVLVGECPPAYEYEENTIDDLIFAAGKLWVVMPGSSSFQTIDPATGLVEPPIRYAGYPTVGGSLGYDGQRLWVGSLMDIGLRAFDPQSGDRIHDLLLYGGPGAMLLIGEELWVINGNSVSEVIDPVSGEIIREVMAGGLSLAYDGRRLWFVDGTWVIVIDPAAEDPFASETTYKIISLGSSPAVLAFDGTRMWVADAVDNTIQPIDTATLEPGDAIAVGNSPSALLFDGTRLWIANRGDATVQSIMP